MKLFLFLNIFNYFENKLLSFGLLYISQFWYSKRCTSKVHYASIVPRGYIDLFCYREFFLIKTRDNIFNADFNIIIA